jgi:ketosteroid isomerase-like protein
MNKYTMLLAIVFVGCQQATEYSTPDPDVLIDVDIEFSKMSEENGLSEAFIFFADQDVVKLSQGEYPVVGKSKLSEAYSALDDSQMSLTWEPLKAELAQSGELGYTYGKYYFTTSDSVENTTTGYYFSVWKKQTDGSWKYVLDGGAEGPVE